jgi:hypothetical protein
LVESERALHASTSGVLVLYTSLQSLMLSSSNSNHAILIKTSRYSEHFAFSTHVTVKAIPPSCRHLKVASNAHLKVRKWLASLLRASLLSGSGAKDEQVHDLVRDVVTARAEIEAGGLQVQRFLLFRSHSLSCYLSLELGLQLQDLAAICLDLKLRC